MLGPEGRRTCDRPDYRRPAFCFRRCRYMNLNTDLMIHLQNAPVALKTSLIALIIHPPFVVA
jgi:hypothetical protein